MLKTLPSFRNPSLNAACACLWCASRSLSAAGTAFVERAWSRPSSDARRDAHVAEQCATRGEVNVLRTHMSTKVPQNLIRSCKKPHVLRYRTENLFNEQVSSGGVERFSVGEFFRRKGGVSYQQTRSLLRCTRHALNGFIRTQE